MYGCSLNNLVLSSENIKNLLIVAEKYQIETLPEICANYTQRFLVVPENIIFLMNIRTYFGSINDTAIKKL